MFTFEVRCIFIGFTHKIRLIELDWNYGGALWKLPRSLLWWNHRELAKHKKPGGVLKWGWNFMRISKYPSEGGRKKKSIIQNFWRKKCSRKLGKHKNQPENNHPSIPRHKKISEFSNCKGIKLYMKISFF